MGYKAGMTHIVRELDRVGSKAHRKEVVEAVTVVETPPMVVVGIVGYTTTPRGLRQLTTVWADKLSESCIRRFYKHFKGSKKAAFRKYQARAASEEGKKYHEEQIARIVKYCSTIRVLAHTQIEKLNLRQKKAHIMEIQINGGSVADKVKYAKGLLEQQVPVADVFDSDEHVDVIGVTKGHGFEGTWQLLGWGRGRRPKGKIYYDAGLDLAACSYIALSRVCRRHSPLGRKEAATQDTQGPPQGGLHRRVASCPRVHLGASCWSERLPPPYREEQEDLPHWQGLPQG